MYPMKDVGHVRLKEVVDRVGRRAIIDGLIGTDWLVFSYNSHRLLFMSEI